MYELVSHNPLDFIIPIIVNSKYNHTVGSIGWRGQNSSELFLEQAKAEPGALIKV